MRTIRGLYVAAFGSCIVWSMTLVHNYLDVIRNSVRILRPLVTFAENTFFLIVNKQEYNKHNLIYFILVYISAIFVADHGVVVDGPLPGKNFRLYLLKLSYFFFDDINCHDDVFLHQKQFRYPITSPFSNILPSSPK
jgi:hypothetical protein